MNKNFWRWLYTILVGVFGFAGIFFLYQGIMEVAIIGIIMFVYSDLKADLLEVKE